MTTNRSEYMREYRRAHKERMNAQERAAYALKAERVQARRRAAYALKVESGQATRRNRPPRKPEMSLVERFWSKVDEGTVPAHIPEIGPCWEWRGTARSGDYGLILVEGKLVGTHRFSLQQALGRPLGEKMQACHRCDNRRCVRPSHLFEGTQSANQSDMAAKGRGRRSQQAAAA